MSETKLTLTFLGTGTSCGVPVIGCDCPVCQSQDPHDHRSRCCAMLESETTRLLIDCGPDIREQMMHVPFRKIDGVLLTHIHYDHVGGLDDLRPFCRFGDIPVYANRRTESSLHETMPYVFGDDLYPGVPRINLHVLRHYRTFRIGDIPVTPFHVMHHDLPISAFRFGRLAYITDMKRISSRDEAVLSGVEVLVVNALRFTVPHHSHMLVDDAIAFSRRIGARETYFIHTTHDIGLHDEANARLPEGFRFAYDGQKIVI